MIKRIATATLSIALFASPFIASAATLPVMTITSTAVQTVTPIPTVTLAATSLGSYGYIGNGASHPLSTVRVFNGRNTTGWTLSQWQAVLPAATSLTDEIDWAAVQSSINAQASTGIVNIHIPAGTGMFNKRIVVPGTVQFSLVGTGSATSVLLFTNAAANAQGIYMSVSDAKYWMKIDGVALQTSVDQPNGTAISYQLASDGSGYARPIYVHDVYIGGSARSYPFLHYWHIGIDMLNANFGEISGFFIAGSAANATEFNTPPTASNMRYGIWIHTPPVPPGKPSSDGIKIHDGVIFQSQTGIQIDNDAEMDRITNVDIVGVNNGVTQSDGRGTSAMYMSDNHIYTRGTGVVIKNSATGVVSNNLIFLDPPASTIGTAIVLASATNRINVSGNQIHNTSQAAGATKVGIQIDNTSFANTISGNLCSGLDYCLQTAGAPGSAPNWITGNSLYLTTVFDLSPSPSAIYTNNHGLPVGDQIGYFALNSTTPNASFPSGFVRTNATVPTWITSFSSAVFEGPEFIVQCADANTSFYQNAKLILMNGTSFTCTIGKILKFKPIGYAGIAVQTQ